jgi:hypothetical protein
MPMGSPFRLTQASEARKDASSDAAASSHIPSWTKMCAGMCSAWLDWGATFA